MRDLPSPIPHFLRVVRALAKVKSPLPVLAVVATVVAGTSCACDGFCGMSPTCSSDADCGGLFCSQGMCIELVTNAPCTKDSQCGKGQVCDKAAGLCADGGAACKSSADCGPDQACDGTICSD